MAAKVDLLLPSVCVYVLLAPQVMHPPMGVHPPPMGLNPHLSTHMHLAPSMGLLQQVQPLTCLHLCLPLGKVMSLSGGLHNMQPLLLATDAVSKYNHCVLFFSKLLIVLAIERSTQTVRVDFPHYNLEVFVLSIYYSDVTSGSDTGSPHPSDKSQTACPR